MMAPAAIKLACQLATSGDSLWVRYVEFTGSLQLPEETFPANAMRHISPTTIRISESQVLLRFFLQFQKDSLQCATVGAACYLNKLSARLSGKFRTVGPKQQVRSLPNRSGVKQSQLPSGGCLDSRRPGHPAIGISPEPEIVANRLNTRQR
jgi:hypothetical protein